MRGCGDHREFPLGGREEFHALAGPLYREQRIATRDESFARIRVTGDLAQIPLIEEGALEIAVFDQRTNRRRPQRGDPREPLGGGVVRTLHVVRHAGVGDQSPIADEHDARHAEALARFGDRGAQRLRITRIPRKYFDRNGTPLRRAQQADYTLRLPPRAIAMVSEFRERARVAFEITRRHVVAQQRAVGEKVLREFGFDARLSHVEPIQRRVERLGIDVGEPQFLAQRIARGSASSPRAVASLEPGVRMRATIMAITCARSGDCFTPNFGLDRMATPATTATKLVGTVSTHTRDCVEARAGAVAAPNWRTVSRQTYTLSYTATGPDGRRQAP